MDPVMYECVGGRSFTVTPENGKFKVQLGKEYLVWRKKCERSLDRKIGADGVFYAKDEADKKAVCDELESLSGHLYRVWDCDL
jgi:hypothetical protein